MSDEQELLIKPDLITLFPYTFKKFLEIQELANAENKLFEDASTELTKFLYNQFVLTSDYYGIQNFEELLNIKANPVTDDLHFRKQRVLNRLITLPPFTMRVLRNKFDSLIGKNKWVAYLDYDNYALTLESSGKNQRWYNELLFIVFNMIPANLIFINSPVDKCIIIANEKISYQEFDYALKLGQCRLGQSSSAQYADKGTIKAAQTKSISDSIFYDLAEFAESQLKSAVLNNSIIIPDSQFITKSSVINALLAIYEVDNDMGIDTITNAALKDIGEKPMTISECYVPVKTKQLYKHIMKFREGNIVPLNKIVQFSFLEKLAVFSKSLFSKALINNSVEIEFTDKAAFNNNMVIRYKILKEEMNISLIRNIKLLDKNGAVRTQCDCYIEIKGNQIISHIFTFDEGVESLTSDAASGYGVLPVSLQGYGE